MKTLDLPALLNREFKLPDDGMFQFAPIGEYPLIHPTTKKRIIQVVDAEAVRLMAADLANRRAKPGWAGLMVDRDHLSYEAGKESRAAGWAEEAEGRGDGLWGKIRFTNSGRADVEGGDYRFLSPVFDGKSAQPLGNDRFRVTKLIGLALTNQPNLTDITALSNRADDFNGREAHNQNPPTMNKVIVLLSLAATATEDEVVSAVQALKNRVALLEPFQGQLTTLQGEHTALKNRHNALLTASVDNTLAEFSGVITEEAKDDWKNRLTQDFDGTVKLLKGIKPAKETKPIHSKEKPAGTKPGAQDDDSGEVVFMNRVNAVMSERKLDRADAIAVVASEEPKLYAGYRAALTSQDDES